MTIDRKLLKRILEHYKHRLDGFLEDEKIKSLANGHLVRHLTDLKREVDASLAELTSLETSLDTETKNWIRVHARVVKPAAAQYEKDVKQLLEEVHNKLSEPSLRELEIELARLAAELATLLNL